jgi:hypothetical protein
MSAACQFVEGCKKDQPKQQSGSATNIAGAHVDRGSSRSFRVIRITDKKTGKVDYEESDSPK